MESDGRDQNEMVDRACVSCPNLYRGELDCPECGEPGEPLSD